MNVAAYQEKEKNEKTGNRESGEERKLTVDKFQKDCVLSFCGRSGAARRKNGLCEEECPR